MTTLARPIPAKLLDIVRTPSGPAPSHLGRDDSAFEIAWRSKAARLSEEQALGLEREHFALMAQPKGDEYPWEACEEKVLRVYSSTATGVRPTSLPLPSPEFTATILPFTLPSSPSGDLDRVRRLWAHGIAAVPVAKGKKGGKDTNPKFKHLEAARPTEDDWRKWGTIVKWRGGNTFLLFGNEAPGVTMLYDIEVENFQEFWEHPSRDYFLEHTPVIQTKKSAHILIASADHEVLGTKKIDGRLEFRGHNNYTLAPGSEHPDSTPEKPIFYEQINPLTDTILSVTNVRAFVLQHFPDFRKAWQVAGQGVVEIPLEEHHPQPSAPDKGDPMGAYFTFQKSMREAMSPQDDIGLQIENAPVDVMANPHYINGGILARDTDILLPETRWCLSTRDLYDLQVEVSDGDAHDVRARRYQTCLWLASRLCKDHGVQWAGRRYCLDPACIQCPTPTTWRLSGIRLPDLPPDSSGVYRTIEFTWAFGKEVRSVFDLADRLKQEAKWFGGEISKIAHHKGIKGKLLFRNSALRLARVGGGHGFYGTVCIQEDVAGESDPTWAKLEKKIRARAAQREFTRREVSTRKGLGPVVQAMLSSSIHLLGMDDALPTYWIEWQEFSRGYGLFQSYGRFLDLEHESSAGAKEELAKKPEPPTECPECEQPLREQIHPPEVKPTWEKALQVYKRIKWKKRAPVTGQGSAV